jgi:hypothetical protein
MATDNQSGGSPKDPKKPKKDSNSAVILDSDGYVTEVNDVTGDVTIMAWVPETSGQQIDRATAEVQSRSQEIYDYYASVKQLPAITKYLIAKYPALKNAVVGDQTYRRYFNAAIAEASSYNFQQTHSDPNGQGKTLSLLDYLKKNPTGTGGGSKTSTSVSYTLKEAAWNLYRSSYEQLTGRKANSNLFDEYYDKLHKEEGKFVNTGTRANGNTVSTGGQLDINDFTLRYLINNVELEGNLKGKLGENQIAIQRMIDESGLAGKVSADAQAKYLKQLAKGQMTENDVNNILRQKAASVYSAFADDIEGKPGLTVKDILDPYTQRYSAYLELDAGSVDYAEVAKMATGQDAKKIGLWDFERSLKKDDRYSYTKQAASEAQDLARSFARAFGVNV